jgi:hypothetical protein
MCGIFGIVKTKSWNWDNSCKTLVNHSEQRGRDSSGLLVYNLSQSYEIYKADFRISKLYKAKKPIVGGFMIGHSRLITNGLLDNQPVYRDDIIVFHNGIILNEKDIWDYCKKKPDLQIDTELIPALASYLIGKGFSVEKSCQIILEKCEGVISCAMLFPKFGKLVLFSNNGSLFVSTDGDDFAFASEKFPLRQMGCEKISQIYEPLLLNVPKTVDPIKVSSFNERKLDLIPPLSFGNTEEKLLVYRQNNLKRCSRCVLPETMPFIRFNSEGVCNYCLNYTKRNIPRPKEELFNLVEVYRQKNKNDCIIPFSGGRDSCFGLHLAVMELGMKPITYTYDWGMVTDLARRNISRMCAKLKIENIIIADDIIKKRRNIKKNLLAWLKSPNLGMVSILTAGDKHFFNFIERVKKQTDLKLNLWGVNPLEVTHFKSGFLGIPPDFEEKLVYSNGALKQLRYQSLRLGAMLKNPTYFNSSLWDTLSGEYYRSFKKKSDYFHLFDFWKWEEDIVDSTLDSYEWEKAPDTHSTWRIGDGTAAFYNYIYYTVAGFTEHDTFRSNQIREGDLTRSKALELIEEENRPRYPNIKWYLDAIEMDFADVINKINKIPKCY